MSGEDAASSRIKENSCLLTGRVRYARGGLDFWMKPVYASGCHQARFRGLQPNSKECSMPKWVLYGLAAAADIIIAGLFYSNGRVVLPAILAIGGVCFVFASVGAYRETKPKA
jgi:hypothetical protein